MFLEHLHGQLGSVFQVEAGHVVEVRFRMLLHYRLGFVVDFGRISWVQDAFKSTHGAGTVARQVITGVFKHV